MRTLAICEFHRCQPRADEFEVANLPFSAIWPGLDPDNAVAEMKVAPLDRRSRDHRRDFLFIEPPK